MNSIKVEPNMFQNRDRDRDVQNEVGFLWQLLTQ